MLYADPVTDPGQQPIALRRQPPRDETPAATPDVPEFDPRTPLLPGHAKAFETPKKSLKTYLSEPGGWVVLAILASFALFVWACCLVTALFLANGLSMGEMSLLFGIQIDLQSFGGIALMGTALFGLILLGWFILGGSRNLMSREQGVIDRVLDLLVKRQEEAMVLDVGPALLARKRGHHAEAARLYREWMREHPDRLDLRYHLAEVEHEGLGDREAGLRGYRDFLRRLRSAHRSPTPDEAGLVPLAEARIADLERPPEPPPERRRIKI